MTDKILIVDDDAEFRSELKDYLDDYEVVEASGGSEALQLLKKAHQVGLVILDVMMPGLSGMDVLREIKNADPDISIVILTGYSSKDVAIEALKAHADDYIEKPLDIHKIKEIVDRLLENKLEASGIDTKSIKGKIEKIKRFTERNCYKKISLRHVAEEVCLSPKYLSRIFKQVTGRSFSEYRLGLKMEKAKHLLLDTGYNINQIADKLAYQNAESFIRIFSKNTGCTPADYRNSRNNKKACKRRKLKKKSK
ncbi:MAG: response regulator [Candidatus Omnitrophota bacterium]